jgi:hypothetical protein
MKFDDPEQAASARVKKAMAAEDKARAGTITAFTTFIGRILSGHRRERRLDNIGAADGFFRL